MRNLVLVIFISLLSINSLFAQKREHIRVVPKLSHSYVLPLKHNKTDSLFIIHALSSNIFICVIKINILTILTFAMLWIT